MGFVEVALSVEKESARLLKLLAPVGNHCDCELPGSACTKENDMLNDLPWHQIRHGHTCHSRSWHQLLTQIIICDRACENQPCEHKKIADCFRLCSIITYELFIQTQ